MDTDTRSIYDVVDFDSEKNNGTSVKYRFKEFDPATKKL